MITAFAVALGAVAQGVTGLGFSLVSAPFLIAVLGAREGVRTALVLSTFLNVALLAGTHRAVLVREGAVLLVPAVATTPFLAYASRRVDAGVLAVAAGGLTIVSAAALASGLRWRGGARPRVAVGAGVASAAMNVVGSIGGPALALYAVNAGWPPERARPTLQVIFLTTNVVALCSLGLPQRRPGQAVLLASMAVGLVLGMRIARRVPEAAARAATLGIAAAGGAAAIARTLL